jgi:hypothetical protein
VEGARARMDKEVALKKRLETGVSLFELLNMQAALDATGIEVRDTTWQEDEARRR